MWTPTTREQYTRTAARYETDLTDAEWAMIEPHMPPRSKRGRPPSWTFREILDAIFYVLRGGIPWRLMPSDLPPWPTVYGRFAARRDSGLFETINHALVMTDRVRVGREASPSAAIIDSQSVKTTESGKARKGSSRIMISPSASHSTEHGQDIARPAPDSLAVYPHGRAAGYERLDVRAWR